MSERLAKHQAPHPCAVCSQYRYSGRLSACSGRLLAVRCLPAFSYLLEVRCCCCCRPRPRPRRRCCWLVAVGFVVLFCVFFVFSVELRQAPLPHPVRSSRGQHFELQLEFRRRRTFGLPANETDQRQNRRHRAQLTCCCVRSTIAALLQIADCKNPRLAGRPSTSLLHYCWTPPPTTRQRWRLQTQPTST